MPYGSRYRVPLRRRREQKTDYQARKGFVVSGKPRLVVRSSLKNTLAQIVVAKPKGDEVLASAHSRELVNKFAWKAATGNIPAAYLTGLLCGLKAKKGGVSEAILDLGLVSPTKGAKVFATMSGVVDAGVAVPHDAEKIVKERNQGHHIQEYAESLGEPASYAPKFSASVALGLAPDAFYDHFVEVRNSVLTSFGVPIPKEEPKVVKAKKPEPKPVKAEVAGAKPVARKVETKPQVILAKVVEAKKPEVAEVKVEPVVEAKPKVEAIAKPKVEAEVEKPKEPVAKPKAKAKTKPKAAKVEPAAKKSAAKAAKVEEAAAVEPAEAVAKPKRVRKKAVSEETKAKPVKKKVGVKKE